MKKIISIIMAICAMFSMTAYAQLTVQTSAQDTTAATRYMSVFGDSVADWYELLYMSDSWVYGGASYQWQVSTMDTVVISDTVYHRCLRKRSYGTEYWLSSVFYLRESENAERLYLRDASCAELLIMDLSLNEGDTLFIGDRNCYGSWVQVPPIRIEHVYFQNERKYLVTNYYRESWTGETDTLVFIEGIGPNMGVRYPILKCWGGSGSSEMEVSALVCFDKDGINEFHHEKYYYGRPYVTAPPMSVEYCLAGWEGLGIDEEDRSPITIGPNPMESRIKIEGIPTGGCELKIVSSNGMILNKMYVNKEVVELDLSSLSAGIYLLILHSNSICVSKKILKW